MLSAACSGVLSAINNSSFIDYGIPEPNYWYLVTSSYSYITTRYC